MDDFTHVQGGLVQELPDGGLTVNTGAGDPIRRLIGPKAETLRAHVGEIVTLQWTYYEGTLDAWVLGWSLSGGYVPEAAGSNVVLGAGGQRYAVTETRELTGAEPGGAVFEAVGQDFEATIYNHPGGCAPGGCDGTAAAAVLTETVRDDRTFADLYLGASPPAEELQVPAAAAAVSDPELRLGVSWGGFIGLLILVALVLVVRHYL